jgi:hypothetical protein
MSKTDREQIQELMATYAYCIDARDYAGLADCFLEGCTAKYSGHSPALNNRDEIMAHMKLALTPLDATQHLFANFLIDVDGDQANLRAGILAQHVKNGANGPETYLSGGKYTVELKRAGGKWKLAKVQGQPVWNIGNAALLPKF